METVIVVLVVVSVGLFLWVLHQTSQIDRLKNNMDRSACFHIHYANIYEELAKELDIDGYGEEDADPADFVRQALRTVWKRRN